MLIRILLGGGILLATLAPASSIARSPGVPEDNWEYVSDLLKRTDLPPDWRDRHGRSLAWYHLSFGSHETAARLIKQVRTKRIWREGEDRLLNIAISVGSQEVVRALLESGDIPGLAPEQQEDPLALAASLGRLEIMKMLLRAGANPNLVRPGAPRVSAAHMALAEGRDYAFRVLLDNGFDLKPYRQDLGGDNLLFYAIAGESDKSVGVLVRNGFDLNKPRKEGRPPLLWALSNRSSIYMVQLLLVLGADPCIQDTHGRNAIQMAAQPMKLREGGEIRYDPIFAEVNCDKASR